MAATSVPDPSVSAHLQHYVAKLGLEREPLWITTSRSEFERALGRRVGSSIGGAFVFHPTRACHLILINLARIDTRKPRAVEVVVAEELVHMRDWIDGDRRRHAKHGHDRIAHRVSQITGASLEEIRDCLLPVARRQFRYLYRCPGCRRAIERKRRGTWSCARCSPRFDPRFVFELVRDYREEVTAEESGDPNRQRSSPA